MTANADAAEWDGFVGFYRRYTRTWVHTLCTVALTAFGILTFVHRGFAIVAVAAYVLPPLALYLTGREPTGARPAAGDAGATPDDEGREVRDERDDGTDRETTDEGEERDERPETATRTPDPDAEPAWRRVDAPTEATLTDVAVASDAAYAVGDGGVVLSDDDDGWAVALRDGPGAASNALRGVAATDDGDAVWVAGDGGALARFDAATGRHVDYSAPGDRTDTWSAVAAGGEAGNETVLLATGSGTVLRGRYRDGEVAWDEPQTPGSGSSMSGLSLAGEAGHACDTNDGVFETGDGGRSFERVGCDAAGTLTDVVTLAAHDCLVSADDGVVHRYADGRWTPERVCDGALVALASDDDLTVAAGEGAVFERDGGEWERFLAPGGSLRGASVGDGRALAVGDDGTILERSAGQ
ncbi:hypothetical protein [Halomarina ordinaria]|uniref:PQQ-binding-like beta-propeller repeat protein n=1 Tax=Halomarina ordinaria TaxID=3033939 RepID=A0ABD5U760_9EURY|nr:hypothetical protein [Halomarina sp. PSRA2]